MNGIRAKVDYILKHNMVINRLYKFGGSAFFKFIGLFVPMDEKAILFSGHTRKYNDSPRAIYEYMINNPAYSDYHFIWALDDPTVTLPGPAEKVIPDTMKYFITALKCKYWITCVNIERSLHFKKKKTVYLNTFHGITIKTCGNDASGRMGDYDFSNINFACISGEYERPIYIRAYNLNPSCIIETGLPRNDVLYNTSKEEIKTLKRKMKIPLDKKIILYAPTWRDSLDGGKTYVIKPPIDFAMWREKLGDQYVVLMRAHPYTNTLMGIRFDSFIMDFTDYPTINDLLKVSDILISDYSATIFDFTVLERPIICFGYDYEEYSKARGFTLDLKNEIPGGVLSTENQVIDRILTMDYDDASEETRRFKHKYVTYGGHATEKCVETMFERRGS